MDLAETLKRHRSYIITEWVRRILTEVSERYSRMPREEITETVTTATEANFEALIAGDFSKMDVFIRDLTRRRLNSGFSLSEIQAAFEFYRTVVMPFIVEESDRSTLVGTLEKLNDCLSHTIRSFSDHFEAEHQKAIRAHAENLECVVEERTRELADSEAKYRMLVEDINDGYFVIRKGTMAFANRAFCEMHGYSNEEVIGRPYMDFVAPESREELVRIYEERKVTGDAPDQYIFLRLHRDGRRLYSENRVKVVLYDGKISTAGICRDITERMELEKQKLRTVELENERKTIALTTMRQLMVTLSHYLLNANTVIGGMARRTARALSDDERKAALDAIRRETRRTEGVIEALSKMTSIKTMEYTPESHTLMIDLTKEIEDALSRPDPDGESAA